MRKVFLENLPRYQEGTHKGKINWKQSAKLKFKVNFIYDDIEDEVEIIDYDIKSNNLSVKYKDIYKIGTGKFQKCNFGKLLGKITKEFKIEIGTRFKDGKRDLIITDRECCKNKKYYKYKCTQCGWDDGWMREDHVLKGMGCSCCKGRTVVPNINSIVAKPETMWMVKYFQGGYEEAKLYTPQSNQKLYFKCPYCGRVKDRLTRIGHIYDNHSIGCSCSDGQSYPFKIMFSVLEQLDIEFQTEYTPNWCKFLLNNKTKKGRYDFYFEQNNKEYIVETDGGWHNKDNHMNGQTKEESKFIDDEKDKLANEHGIEVIRINCEKSDLEYIKNNIINSRLTELFDLNKIDWVQAEEFALRNMVLEACNIKRNNPNLFASQIGKMINLNVHTVITYLKKGTKLGWCSYNPKDEHIKNASKIGKACGKPVEIFKDGKSLGIFPSTTELERQSEKLFGVKLNQGNISEVCLNKKKIYKSFIFKYLT